MRRKLIEFLCGLGLVIGLGACAVETYGEPVGELNPPTTAATPAPPSNAENERPTLRGMFLREVRREIPEARGVGDERLVAAGQKVCDQLRSGRSFFQAAQVVVLDGLFSDAEDSGFLAGAAVPAFCSDQMPRVVEEIGPIDDDGGY